MNSISFGDWKLLVEDGTLPTILDSYIENAGFTDRIDIFNPDGRFLFLGISKGEGQEGWPTVVSIQKYKDEQGTFSAGVLIVPETALVFVGAGDRLLCYDIENQERVWEEETLYGFWGWSRSGAYVLMSAEVEFGVWDQSGKRLWSAWVEPPWSFVVSGETVELDVKGVRSTYRLEDGLKVD